MNLHTHSLSEHCYYLCHHADAQNTAPGCPGTAVYWLAGIGSLVVQCFVQSQVRIAYKKKRMVLYVNAIIMRPAP